MHTGRCSTSSCETNQTVCFGPSAGGVSAAFFRRVNESERFFV